MSEDLNFNNVNQFFDDLIFALRECEEWSPIRPGASLIFSEPISRWTAAKIGGKAFASNLALLNDRMQTFKLSLQLARFDFPKIKLPGMLEMERDVLDYAMDLLCRCQHWHETEAKSLRKTSLSVEEIEYSNEGYPVEFGRHSWQSVPVIIEGLELARSLVLRYEIAGSSSIQHAEQVKPASKVKRRRKRPPLRTLDELDALNSTKRPAVVDEIMIRKGAKCYFRHDVIDWYQGHTAALKTRERALGKSNGQTKHEP